MPKPISPRDNFQWLLGALIFLLFSGAVFAQFESEQGQRLNNITLMITMLVAVWSMEIKQTRWMNRKIGMTLIIASVMIGDTLLEDNRLSIWQLAIAFSFMSLTTYQAWRQVMFTGRVDGNKIVGAICIYILLGLVWAFAYLLVESFFPSSFNGLEHKMWQHNLQDMFYYSMVTLTTLGYGDITPAQPVARFLAYMESITGIFYTTVLVASLIGIRLAGYHPEEDDATPDTDTDKGN
jgi:voltage-gated potassium channel